MCGLFLPVVTYWLPVPVAGLALLLQTRSCTSFLWWLLTESSLSATTAFLMDHHSILSPPQVQVPALHPSRELIDSITPTRQYHLSEVWVPGPQLPSSELRGLSTSHYLKDGSLAPQGPSTKLPNFNNPNPRNAKCLLWLLLPRCFSSSISG